MPERERRRDIDWLRIGAVYLLLPFHVGKTYDVGPFYHLKNETLLPALDYVTGLLHIWHMPLLFLLAGWSAQRSLRARGGRAFAVERVRRILVPLVAGCILLCPWIAHVEYNVIRGLDGSVGESLVRFFTDPARFTWSHLWFLAYLLVFTLLTVPWLARLRADRVAPRTARAWRVWLPLPILVATQIWLRPRWPGYQNLYDDWANVTYYATFFVTGFLLARDPALEATAHRQWRFALGVALAATALYAVAAVGGGHPALARVSFAFASLGWVVALLGLSHRFLRDRERGRTYLAESAYPVYVLHQFFVVVPGYFLTRLAWPVLPEALLLLAVASAGTLGAYRFVVRPFACPRLLLGLRPR